MAPTPKALDWAYRAAWAAEEKLATDIRLIDVSDRLGITDIFVLATGANDRQVQAISDEVEAALDKIDVDPVRREGQQAGRWILLDYSDIVVHIQHAEERAYYDLERLWKDCPELELPANPHADQPATDEA
ncbi:MAG: hypothetical protein RIS75_1091 [Actinomycetota bacterium]